LSVSLVLAKPRIQSRAVATSGPKYMGSRTSVKVTSRWQAQRCRPERAACLGYARDLTGRLPAPATDVKDTLTRLDAICPAQDLVVPPQFVVVVNKTSLRGKKPEPSCQVWR
jgi:hypothetical protein